MEIPFNRYPLHLITMLILWLQAQERAQDSQLSQPQTPASTGFMSWIPGKQGARTYDHSLLLEAVNPDNKPLQDVSVTKKLNSSFHPR